MTQWRSSIECVRKIFDLTIRWKRKKSIKALHCLPSIWVFDAHMAQHFLHLLSAVWSEAACWVWSALYHISCVENVAVFACCACFGYFVAASWMLQVLIMYSRKKEVNKGNVKCCEILDHQIISNSNSLDHNDRQWQIMIWGENTAGSLSTLQLPFWSLSFCCLSKHSNRTFSSQNMLTAAVWRLKIAPDLSGLPPPFKLEVITFLATPHSWAHVLTRKQREP